MKQIHKILKRVAAVVLAGAMMMAASFTAAAAPEIGKATSASVYITAQDWPTGPDVESESAVLIEADTGTVLYAKNPDTLMYPASITKIMTALLALENYSLSDVITYTSEANRGIPSGYTTVALQAGEQLTVEDSLYALLLYSTNDIANGLAIDMAGSTEQFAQVMNEKAAELGCKNTHFTNPSGIEDDDHYTTAYDICMIMRECIKNEDFNTILSTRTHTLEVNNKRTEAFTFANKNSMIFPKRSEYYQYCVCGKTGYTDIALNTLITYAEKDGMKLICCTMKGGKGVSYKDTKKLYEYGFSNFSVADSAAIDEKYTLSECGIFSEESGITPDFSIQIMDGSSVVLPAGISLSQLDYNLSYLTDDPDGCFAEMVYSYEGMTMGTTRLKMNGTQTETSENGESGENSSAAVNESQTEPAAGSAFESAQDGQTLADGETAADSKNADSQQTAAKKVILLDVRLVIAAVVVLIVIIVLLVIYFKRKNDPRIRYNSKVKINWKRRRR